MSARVKTGAKKRCCYGLCRSDTRSKTYLESLYYFISFPKPCYDFRHRIFITSRNKHLQNCAKCAKSELWVKRCGRADGRFQGIEHVTKDTYICSLHFDGESGPTAECPDPISCVNKRIKKKANVTRTSLAEKYKQLIHVSNEDVQNPNPHVEIMDCTDDESELNYTNNGAGNDIKAQLVKNLISSLNLDVSNEDHATTSDDRDCETITADFPTNDDEPPKAIRDEGVQTDIKNFRNRWTQISVYQISAIDKFEKSIKIDNKKCKFYTGLVYREIENLHNFVNPESKAVNEDEDESCEKLTSIQQLVLVLIRLRFGTVVQDLAYRFEIPTSLVSKTLKFWMQLFYDRFELDLKPFMFASKKRICLKLSNV